MGEAAEAVIYYTLIILYTFFKLIVVFHAAKNKKGFLWVLAVLIPGIDFYYYFKFVKTN